MNDQHSTGGEFENVDRVLELTWQLIDEQMDEATFAELQELLLTSEAARENYIQGMQLHVDLQSHFAAAAKQQTPSATTTPVLGFLGEGLPQFGMPTVDDATA